MQKRLALTWLEPHQPFPPLSKALGDDTPWPGLLAAGGALDGDTLQAAYAQGIFPWYSAGEPPLWWSTDPRMVLRPQAFRLHTSLRKRLRAFRQTGAGEIRIDTAFAQVMQHCAAPRQGQSGTWITPAIIAAYTNLHRRGLAHSVETWANGQLVGGLYCVALGHAVFGESMFAHQSDASKMALSALVCLCRAHGVEMIDCQQETAHLASLGAAPVARAEFLASITRTQQQPAMRWCFDDGLWEQLA